MSDETNEERQDNELAVLQAIYGDAVVDNRETVAWKIWRPLDLMLTLLPLHNSDIKGVHCSVTLHFKCSKNYPDEPLSLAIHKVRGISTENSKKLLSELEDLAQKLRGEVCIYQLAQHAQQFLHVYNVPILSFYDEMLKQKNELEQLKLHDLKVKENEERQKMKDEIQKRQEILKAGKQRIQRSSVSQENDSLDGQGDAPELVYYADENMSPAKKIGPTKNQNIPCTCKNKKIHVMRITQRNNKKHYIGKCLGHSSNGSITRLAIDDEGEQLIAKQWITPPANDFQTRTRQLTSMHQDLKAMSRLNHPSLIPYIAMETFKDSNKRTSKQYIYLFRNFVLGSDLKSVKNRLSVLSDRYEGLKLLRHVGLGVLGALKELHSVGIVHKDVRAQNVFLDDFGGVKLVGIGLDMRLAEMIDGDAYCDRTEAQDIFATGQMLLSIVSQGQTYLEIPSDLPSSAKDFFARCLTEDEQSQWSAAQLMNHVFLIDAPAQLPSSKMKDVDGSCSEDDEAVKKIHQGSPMTRGHSRLNAEFEALTWLGKGAFGDVLKVKNKLDGGFYAIKRVKLDPESVQLNKKITREVKLLSRLNHENVVRYYNAWIESSVDDCVVEDDSSVKIELPREKKTENSLQDIVAKLGQDVKLEWSISEVPVQKTNTPSDTEEDDDDDDEPDPWFTIIRPQDESSSSIEFEEDSNVSQTIPSEDAEATPRPQSERTHQVLYIQMEFCEKHTLRQAIDNGLSKEHFRAWRLFREIVEGLAHVHQRGMIHRDLKPVNIFLDSNDHVKIGDFGLATKVFTTVPVDDKAKEEEMRGSLTGQIGTALYVAPELLQSGTKVIYNQKVDIYSLGIILFEMFHPALNTGMERMLVLSNLRSKNIIMPKNFEKEENSRQIHVIRWLLNHEPSLRPTCAELLCSEHVPRAVPEGALAGLLSHALSDRSARGYKRLIAACLDQRPSPVEDYTYHNEMKNKAHDVLLNIKDAVVKIFRSHGATEFSPPLLIPRASAWDQYPNAVKVMTVSGSVVHLPHDLRLPFARHTAYSGIKYMRRFVVDRVFRERHVPGFHPREIIECAFDIVTPRNDSLWPDAELLVVASRAAAECGLKVSLQLNHTELLRTLLLSCGVPLDKHADMYPVLVDVRFGRITFLQLQTHLTSLCVTKRDVSNLLRLMDADVEPHNVHELVTPFVKQAKWSKLVSHAVHELEAVYRNAMALGCECAITVAPFLAYNATQHSGIFWQMAVVNNMEHKTIVKHRSSDLIAAGGRYDSLVEEFWKVARTEKDNDCSELKTSSVGLSISLERMAAFLKKMEGNVPSTSLPNVEPGLTCVCLWGNAGSGRDGQLAGRRAGLARGLWRAGLAAAGWPASEPASESPSTNDAHELARARVVLLQDDATVRVACWDGVRLREYKVPYIDVIEFTKQKLNPESVKSPDSGSNRAPSWSETEKSSSSQTISVTYITASERMSKNSKRHCENQINTRITSILVTLGLQPVLSRVRVNVFALSCEAPCVRMLAASISAPLDVEELAQAFTPVFEAYPKRRSILEDALHELTALAKQNHQSRATEEHQLYALYSIPDSLCRLVT